MLYICKIINIKILFITLGCDNDVKSTHPFFLCRFFYHSVVSEPTYWNGGEPGQQVVMTDGVGTSCSVAASHCLHCFQQTYCGCPHHFGQKAKNNKDFLHMVTQKYFFIYMAIQKHFLYKLYRHFDSCSGSRLIIIILLILVTHFQPETLDTYSLLEILPLESCLLQYLSYSSNPYQRKVL